MQNGWIKLHRKLLENEFLRRDTNAHKVFCYLLLLVNYETGQWAGGRVQLGQWCGLKATTAYNASRRLEKAKMVTLTNDIKYTTYSICNWARYQSHDDSTDDTVMTARRHDDDTIIKNKEIRNKETIYKENIKPNPDVIRKLDEMKTDLAEKLALRKPA
jgi:hypothetical protein